MARARAQTGGSSKGGSRASGKQAGAKRAGTKRSSTPTKAPRRTLRIHSDDRVQVIAGKDRGKSGRVLRVEPDKERVYVEGLNMIKRHTRPQQTQNAGRYGGGGPSIGGVIEREGPIHVSNVMLLDPKGGKPTRVGVERENGRPFRVARRTGARID
jgi:large subunit ribosomal protein L24